MRGSRHNVCSRNNLISIGAGYFYVIYLVPILLDIDDYNNTITSRYDKMVFIVTFIYIMYNTPYIFANVNFRMDRMSIQLHISKA